MYIGTTKELAAKLKQDYQIIQGLVKYLEIKGLAVKKDKIQSGGKGRSSVVWEITTPCSILEEV